MPAPRIKLVVEGVEKDDGDVRLDVFMSELKQLHNVLTHIDRSVGHGLNNSHFVVVDLSHSSPAMVEVEARMNRGRQDTRPQMIERLSQSIDSALRGEIREDTDFEFLSDLRGLAAPVGSTLKTATLIFDGNSFEITQELKKRIDFYFEEHESCVGTIEGMLERINVHADANVFTIYPDVGPKSLTCRFKPALVETAVAAVSKRVAVTGLAKYRKFMPFPYEIAVDDLEIYGPEESLPSFDDLRGMAPDATGEVPSEVFIARFRDDWV